MCDYSLHAVASRPAQVGETLITTTFRGTSTRGFASESEPDVAVCMLPGTELAFAENVRYDNRWIWTREVDFRVGKFGHIDPHVPDRHHDAIEFPDGSRVLVTLLCEGQRVTVLQLPVLQQPAERAQPGCTPDADAALGRLRMFADPRRFAGGFWVRAHLEANAAPDDERLHRPELRARRQSEAGVGDLLPCG